MATETAIRILAASFLVMLATGDSQSRMTSDMPRSGVVEFSRPAAVPTPGGELGTGPNVNVTTEASPQNETSIAADPSNPLNLLGGANDYRYGDAQAGYAYSLDGGATWDSNTLDGVNPTHGKYDAQGDPAIAPLRDGVFYYAFIDFSRSDYRNRLAIAKTTDGGVTWPTLGVVADHSGPGGQDFEDKEYIAVDNTGGAYDGNVYVTWTRFPLADYTRIMFSRSTNGGITYSTPIQISNSTQSYQGSVPAVGPNGEIFVAWYHAEKIEVDRSTDGGVTWGNDVVVDNITSIPDPLPGAWFRVNSFPTIAVDRSGGPGNGNVYVAWADGQGVGSGPDILFSRSTNGGAAWSTPLRVSDDTNQQHQWFPWMSVDPAGNIDIIFYDRRDVPGSIQFHTYRARSTDAGLSFGPNERVSDEISVATNDGFSGYFIGDYNGLCATADAVHPYWTDCRNSNANAEGYTAAMTLDDPVPDVTANDSDGPVSLNYGENLSIKVALDPGDRAGENADWWLVVSSPAGWFHYEYATRRWLPGVAVSHQGALFAVGTTEAFSGSSLPRGSYTCYFAVDMAVNGSPDPAVAFVDSVEIDIN